MEISYTYVEDHYYTHYIRYHSSILSILSIQNRVCTLLYLQPATSFLSVWNLSHDRAGSGTMENSLPTCTGHGLLVRRPTQPAIVNYGPTLDMDDGVQKFIGNKYLRRMSSCYHSTACHFATVAGGGARGCGGCGGGCTHSWYGNETHNPSSPSRSVTVTVTTVHSTD